MTTRQQIVFLLLSLAAAACGTSVESGGGGEGGEGLDIDVADERDGLHATTEVDGEEIDIEVTVESDPAEAPDDPPYQDFLILTVRGAEDPPYAEWKLGILGDHLTGSYAGVAFGDPSSTGSSAAFADLAASHVGSVLTLVSQRAAVELAADKLSDEVRLYMVSVSDVGPYLQALPTILGGVDPVCGDGVCAVDESDENCPEDCGCAAEEDTCGGVAPFGCYCDPDCDETGDCCVDACQTCGAGCPPCGEAVPCDGSCTNITNACNGTVECPTGEDEAQCNSGACRAGQLACADGTCIEFYQFCDEVNDCAGGEDEVCECAFCDPAG